MGLRGAHTHLGFRNPVRYAFDMPIPFIPLDPILHSDQQLTTNTKSNSSFKNGSFSRLQMTSITILYAALDGHTNQLACTHFIREPNSEERRWDKSGWRGTKSRPVKCRRHMLKVAEKLLTDKFTVLRRRRRKGEYAYLSTRDKDEDARAITLHTRVSNSQSLCR